MRNALFYFLFALSVLANPAELGGADLPPQMPPPSEPAETLVNLGEFKLTAYCPCAKCCGRSDGITAAGAKATAGHTIAVDPDVIPYGSEIVIDGKIYIAEDCGGAISGNRIDIYFDTHAEALAFGVQYAEVQRRVKND